MSFKFERFQDGFQEVSGNCARGDHRGFYNDGSAVRDGSGKIFKRIAAEFNFIACKIF